MDKKPAVTGVSLTDYERKLLLRESERRGLFNLSATLRMILREWEQLNDEQVRITEAGREALQKSDQ